MKKFAGSLGSNPDLRFDRIDAISTAFPTRGSDQPIPSRWRSHASVKTWVTSVSIPPPRQDRQPESHQEAGTGLRNDQEK